MSVATLTFRMCGLTGLETRPIVVRNAVIAGWTGRDPVAREKHITEAVAHVRSA